MSIPAAPTVAPVDATAAPRARAVPASAAQRGGGSMRGTRSRWLPRAARIAAVVAIAAVGATMTARIVGDRAARSTGSAGRGQSDRTTAPSTPVRTKRAPAIADAERALAPQSGSRRKPETKVAQTPRREVASAIPAEAAPTVNATSGDRVSADSIELPRASTSDARVSAAPTTESLPGAQLRLVSTNRVTTPDARVVLRRVYEVRPGVRVILEEAAARADLVGRSEERARAHPSAPAASPAPAALSQLGVSPSSAGLNSIRWIDSTGTQFTLIGRLPTEELRRLKGLVH